MRERLILAAVVGVLAIASAAPVSPIREGRALLLVLGLMALRSLLWSDGWRASVVLVALGLFVWHRDARGFPVVLALYLAGEGIEALRQRPTLVRPLLAFLGVLGLAFAVQGIAQHFNLDPFTCALAPDGVTCLEPRRNHAFAVGLAGEPSSYGTVLALCAPAVALALGRLWPVGAALLVAALVAAHSTGPVLAVCVAGVAWAWARGWRWTPGLVAALALVAYIALVDAPGVERWPVWRAGAAKLMESPVIGHGLGAWAAAKFYEPGRDGYWLEAHNEWLQWAYETGWLGVATLGGYLGRVLLRLWRTAGVEATTLRAMALVGLVTASVHFTAHVAATGVLLILTLGLAEGLAAPVKECA